MEERIRWKELVTVVKMKTVIFDTDICFSSVCVCKCVCVSACMYVCASVCLKHILTHIMKLINDTNADHCSFS